MADCSHLEFIYTLEINEGYYYSEYTQWDGSSYLNRYCASCRKQMGCIDLTDKTDIADISNLEFRSDEIDNKKLEWE